MANINVSVSGVSVVILVVTALSSCICDNIGMFDVVADAGTDEGTDVKLLTLELTLEDSLLIGEEVLLSSILVIDVSTPSKVEAPSEDDLDTVTMDF